MSLRRTLIGGWREVAQCSLVGCMNGPHFTDGQKTSVVFRSTSFFNFSTSNLDFASNHDDQSSLFCDIEASSFAGDR